MRVFLCLKFEVVGVYEIAATHDIEQLKKIYDPALVDRALKLTNSRTAARARTHISREVQKVFNVKARDIKANSSIKRMTNGDSDVMLFYEGRRLSLMYFDAREIKNHKSGRAITTKRRKGGLVSTAAKRRSKKTGVTVKMRKDRGREKVTGLDRFGGKNADNHAFMAQGVRGKSGGGFARGLFNKSNAKQGRGNVQIFVRDGDGRTPLTRLTGPSIPQMVGGEEIMKKTFEFIGRKHAELFSHHLEKLQEGVIK